MPMWGMLLMTLGIFTTGYLLARLMFERSEARQRAGEPGPDPAGIAIPGLLGVVIAFIGALLFIGAAVDMLGRIDWAIVLR